MALPAEEAGSDAVKVVVCKNNKVAVRIQVIN